MFDAISVIVFCAITWLLVGFYQKKTNAFCKSKKRLDGKTAIVTGGTAGMGLKIAMDFARRGARVIIVCPFPEEGKNAKELIVKKTGNMDVVYQHIDLGSLKSVREFAANILKTEERLDILVNNAGVGAVGDFATDDGLNFIVQVNYLGHFLLTLLLLPLLKKSAPSRVINTCSILHWVGKVDAETLNRTGKLWILPGIRCYGISKFCTITFSHEFARRMQGSGVVMNTVDPGAVGTTIYYCLGSILGDIFRLITTYFFKTPLEGAQTAIHVSVDDEAGKVSGELFKNCRQTRGLSSAYDDELTRKLWDQSVKLVKLTEKEMKACFD